MIIILQKPFNINIRGQTIDAHEVNRISWRVTGDISVAFSVKIYSNENQKLVFDSQKINSFATYYDLPANTLQNGKEYQIRVTIWNDKGHSTTSDFEVFQTSSRPVVNIEVPDVINSPSFVFTANYHQDEDVPMRHYEFYLYNKDGVAIDHSGIRIDGQLQYEVSNLTSEETYYIEVIVTSDKGLRNTSGKIEFFVQYTQPQIYVNLTARNIEKGGIELTWDVIQIIGISDCIEVIYIDNEKVDLTDGCSVTFDEGFSVKRNITVDIWIENPKRYVNLIELIGINGKIFLQYWDDNRFHLIKVVNNIRSHYVSNELVGNKFKLRITQDNTHMSIAGEVITEE